MKKHTTAEWAKFPPWITISLEEGVSTKHKFRFTRTFRVGREGSCDIQIKNPEVSRIHLEFVFDGTYWRVRDLGSANGTYLNGVLIQEAELPDRARIELGAGGPALSTEQESRVTPTPASETASITQIAERYFGKSSNTDVIGEHTMMVREAFHRVQKQHFKRYRAIIIIAAIVIISVGGIAFYQQQRINEMSAIAEEIFYTMKTIEIQVGQIESVVLSRADSTQREAMLKKRTEFEVMTQRYNNHIKELGLYENRDLSPEDRLIMRVARIFGECELNIPDAFVKEVHRYIRKWQSTGRLNTAMHRADTKGYTGMVRTTLLNNHLPFQFFYLALQESDFKQRIVGPRTRFGIAKGIWQFIPETAMHYGLQTGPLLEEPHYDPKDERFHFDKATKAAARYLMDIYNGEAQASGLLVIASYNWGHNRVRRLIRGMPENPRERNFWKLLKHYKIPQETYDYVFYIFSAAVIGEDPTLFGFDFESPLS